MLLFFVLVMSCARTNTSEPSSGDIITEDGKIYIVDNTMKRWDITHAVNNYDMLPEQFNYGLGPNAIKPINSPNMLVQGESGYPLDSSNEPVIGIVLHDEDRAYSVRALAGTEVVNDRIETTYISVLY